MKKLILSMLLCMMTLGTVAQSMCGDVDGDNKVGISDVTEMIDYLLSPETTEIVLANADVDADGEVSIADVVSLIDYLLTGVWDEDPVVFPVEHEWVDLGLPSGTLWATMNIGATSPEDYGDYFAWGETSPKSFYLHETYQWWYYDTVYFYFLTKYNWDDHAGLVDNKTELDPSDDAAYMNWGSLWRIPTYAQFRELLDNCFQWNEQRNGINGMLYTGPNGNKLFLPGAGLWEGEYHDNRVCCWTRTLYVEPQGAYALDHSPGYSIKMIVRYCGLPVRAVRAPQN